MLEFLLDSDTPVTTFLVVGGLLIGAIGMALLSWRWKLPKKPFWQLAIYYGGGMLIGGLLPLFFALAGSLFLDFSSPWAPLGTLLGMLLGFVLLTVLPPPPPTTWLPVAYGMGGILVGGLFLGFCGLIGGSALGSPVGPVNPCSTEVRGGAVQGNCPTATKLLPDDDPFEDEQFVTFTSTPTVAVSATLPASFTPTPTPTQQPDATDTDAHAPTATSTDVPPATPTLIPPPSNANLILFHTNESNCSYPDGQHPYLVLIDGTLITLIQVDAGITSSGTYDPVTGAFSTTATGLPGTEIYTGTITFNGTTVTITGTYTYIDPAFCQGLWLINGTGTY